MPDRDPKPPNAWAVSAMVIAILLLLAVLGTFAFLLFFLHALSTTH